MFIRFEMIHERDRQTDRRTDGQTPRAGIYRAQMPSSTSELGDRQSSRPVKTLLQYYGKSLEALPCRCCLPRFQGQPQHLKYQNWILK